MKTGQKCPGDICLAIVISSGANEASEVEKS